MAKPTVQAIPQTIKEDLIALAILLPRLRQMHEAAKAYRQKIEAEMPGASRLASDAALVRSLINEHNAQVAKAVRS